MLKNVALKPITGTFINMLVPDTGITNNGLKEWEQDFQMLKVLGMDQLFIIRTEFEQNGVCLSAEDPRSTTWEEDDNLLDMAFRLGEKYDMSVYLGGPVSISNLHKGDWQKEIDDIIYLPDKFNDFSEAERKKTTEFRQLIFLI